MDQDSVHMVAASKVPIGNRYLLKDKNEAKTDKTKQGIRKSMRPQTQSPSHSPVLEKHYLLTFVTFQLSQEVPLISHRLKVVKLSTTKPEKTLLLSFGELNADSSTDQSLSAIDVQSATQSKAATSKKSKKMKITSSSKCLNASHFNFGGD
ncbi:hypothetical protein Tco_0566798 [Tanacetum coccineum]